MVASNVHTNDARVNKHANDDVVKNRRTRRFYGVFRGLLSLLQALLYCAASAMYFNTTYNTSYGPKTGAALYIAGAFFKLFSEISRLVEDRVGLFCYGKYRQKYIFQRIAAFRYSIYAVIEVFIRIVVGLIDAFLIFAAALDLARSILYLPELNALTVGEAIYIGSSTALLAADVGMIYMIAIDEKDNPYNLTFRIKNLFRQPAKVLSRAFRALAALSYLIGTILFLPELNHTAFDQNRVGGLYEAGAACFLISSVMMLLNICVP